MGVNTGLSSIQQAAAWAACRLFAGIDARTVSMVKGAISGNSGLKRSPVRGADGGSAPSCAVWPPGARLRDRRGVERWLAISHHGGLAPGFLRWRQHLRVKHLLTHTGGGWQNDATDPMFRNPRMNHKQLITWAIETVALRHPPGEHFAYSNFGFCILGRVIEKLTKVVYEQHVRDAILNRCGVTGMRIAGNTRGERAPGEVVYYGAGRQNPYNLNVRRMDSHGGWLATARDLAIFASHVDGHASNRNILEPGSIRQMTTASSANAGYAKGWAVNRFPNWWHVGSLPGTTSIMVRTASGFCWAALANTREAAADTCHAMDLMMWDLVRQVKNWKA
jgi:CubicO group peptidase (beta-lactamase class C family)